MERLGISQEMLDMAKDIGLSLESSMEGIQAIQTSLETQQRLAKLLDQEVNTLYDRAKVALDNSDDDLARKMLMERAGVQEKLKKVLVACTEEKGRLEKMKGNVAQLERRALEIDALLQRSVSARSLQNSSEYGLSLRKEDPLLQKFKNIGID
jgi:phage shock protein A